MYSYKTPRREPRYRLQIAVNVLYGGHKLPMTSADISFSGLYLRSDSAVQVRGLVRLEVTIEGRGEPLLLTGKVLHVVEHGHASGRAPGIAIELCGLGGEARREWIGYVNVLRECHPDAEAVVARGAESAPTTSTEMSSSSEPSSSSTTASWSSSSTRSVFPA
jgi:hypothetical protein